MCHYITLILPSSDLAAIQAVMKRHGRGARLTDNSSVRTVLREGDHQYITSVHECDCGTVLGQAVLSAEQVAAQQAKDIARLKRKGWSEAKIARMKSDQTRPENKNTGPDSFELWHSVLSDLMEGLQLPYAALFVRNYSGGISESFAVTRRETAKGDDWLATLHTLKEDEVTVFA